MYQAHLCYGCALVLTLQKADEPPPRRALRQDPGVVVLTSRLAIVALSVLCMGQERLKSILEWSTCNFEVLRDYCQTATAHPQSIALCRVLECVKKHGVLPSVHPGLGNAAPSARPTSSSQTLATQPPALLPPPAHRHCDIPSSA